MLQRIKLGRKKLDNYKNIIPDELYREIKALAKPLKGKKVLNINATSYGGGVAEILYSLVPLMRDVGLDAGWDVIYGADCFFEITKGLHNAMQGEQFEISERVQKEFNRFNAYNAHLLEGEWDFIVIHDPQPIAIPHYIPRGKEKRIWRCHPDASTPNKNFWGFLDEFLREYDAAVFSMKEYVPKNFPVRKKFIIEPAIDCLTPKNRPMSMKMAQATVESFGIDSKKPIITQISRFDVWKDPVGVYKAFQIVQKKIPDAQLVLVGSMAHDDPEGWKIYSKLEKLTRTDPNVALITNSGDLEVNAFQRAADVVVQKSLREGFGLVVTEAMIKNQPVVAGNVGGITKQIKDGVNGFLVNNVEECSERIIYLLENPDEKKKMGEQAKKTACEKFLIPRLLRDELKMFNELMK